MLSRRSFFAVIITAVFALLTGACGFTPVYAEREDGALLPLIYVDAPDTREGQLFTHELLTALYGDREQPQQAEYSLRVILEEEEFPIDIRRDRTVTRFRIRINGDYVLTRVSDGMRLDKGVITNTGGYDRVDSDYATYVSGRALKERGIALLADDFKRYLTGYFALKSTDVTDTP